MIASVQPHIELLVTVAMKACAASRVNLFALKRQSYGASNTIGLVLVTWRKSPNHEWRNGDTCENLPQKPVSSLITTKSKSHPSRCMANVSLGATSHRQLTVRVFIGHDVELYEPGASE